ncbi:hypothetical protein [Rhizobium giardinii]|uniref:Uncharacterized protein n=1 Tax=Rhizobium giardinii TaxID=56731 RepID=A0A7W8UAQ4_9HYPH|nr:hypothetical protein [Rhizobium giardinii]MBB5535927.1 hypothetical protein [Rhizobium giardinii]
MFIGGWMLKRFGQNDRERTLAAEEGGLYEATLRDYRRKALTISIWAGFAVLTIWAAKPIWNYAIFGFNPILDDLLSITCS